MKITLTKRNYDVIIFASFLDSLTKEYKLTLFMTFKVDH